MARITIKEVDNSSTGALTGTENIVYVPGYAIKGPINTPTLCTTLSDFTSIFGANPYAYVNDQYYDGSATSRKVANAGEFEKSWLYAYELLKQGLPILYERVASKDGVKASTELNFIRRFKAADVVVAGEGATQYAAIEENGVWTLYTITQTGDKGEAVADATFEEHDALLTINSTTASLTGYEAVIQLVDGEESAENKVILEAKYPGKYGASIVISINEFTAADGASYPVTVERLFELFINNTRYVVSFDPNSSRYIEKVLEDSEVTATVTGAGIREFIESNLYGIISETSKALEYTASNVDESTFAGVRAILAGEESPYITLADKTVYDVKFITSGGYYSLSTTDEAIATRMLNCAATRGDALAIVDMAPGVTKEAYHDRVKAVFTEAYVNGEDRNKYGTMIAPNVKVTLSKTATAEWMPASYAYLHALASSVVNNPIWFAISGVVRGAVSNFKEAEFVVDEGISQLWQSDTSVSINPIQNVRPYGYCIYGNRTLHSNVEGLKDSSFTNVRLLVNEAKKVTLKAINRLMFESNDSVLWNNFKSLVEPTLAQMKSDRGITDYKIIRSTTDKKATVAGLIKLQPIEAVENFDITFSLEDSVITVE